VISAADSIAGRDSEHDNGGTHERPGMRNPAAWVRLAGILLFSLPAVLVTRDRSFDLQYHLFFASHYQLGWFNSWDPGWYGGFLVFTYPPLAHQLLALIGAAVGLDAAAYALGVLTSVGLYLALRRLARLLGGSGGQRSYEIVVLGWTSPFVFLFVWGQLPSLMSFTFAVFGVGSLLIYLRGGHCRDLATWSLSTGCCAAAHHQTGFFLLPLLGTAAAFTVLAESRRTSPTTGARMLARRSAAAASGALAATMAAIAPLLWWLATQNLPQAPIPHPTRTDFFANPVTARLFFACVWGLVIIALPLALRLGIRQRRFLPWSLAIACCAVLSLGTITPLPHVLFWGWTNWLTYERFGLWASGLTAVVAGCGLGATKRSAAALLALCSLVGNTWLLATVVLPNQGLPADDAIVRSLSSFLHTGDNAHWRYLTFGLGANRLSRLSRISGAQTVDGFYFMARREPILRVSGVGTIDDAVDYPDGLAVVDQYLSQHDRFALRWIFSTDTRMDARLNDAGWRVTGCIPASRCNNLALAEAAEIWEAPDGPAVPTVTAVAQSPPAIPFGFGVLWGIVPLAELLGLTGLAVRSLSRRLNQMTERQSLHHYR
jgi:hypothetical protein